jgi:hypothetical protein
MSTRSLAFVALASAALALSVGCNSGSSSTSCAAHGTGTGGNCAGPAGSTTATGGTATGGPSTGTTGGGCFNGVLDLGAGDGGKCCQVKMSGGDTAMSPCTYSPAPGQPDTYTFAADVAGMPKLTGQIALAAPVHVGTYTNADVSSVSITDLGSNDAWSTVFDCCQGAMSFGSFTLKITAVNTLAGMSYPTGTLDLTMVSMKANPSPPVTAHIDFGP